MEQFSNKTNVVIGLAALLLGWFADFLFWQKSVGVNFAVFAITCLLVGFLLLIFNGVRPHPRSLWLLIPFFFFVIITFFRREPLTIFLAYTFALFSLGVMVNTYTGGRWMEYTLPDYIFKFSDTFYSIIRFPKEYHSKLAQERGRKIPVDAILRGLLLAFPIELCYASLLSSADSCSIKR